MKNFITYSLGWSTFPKIALNISLKFEVPINSQPQPKKFIILSEKSTPPHFFYIFWQQGRVSWKNDFSDFKKIGRTHAKSEDLICIYQITGAEHDGDKIRAISPIFQKIRFFGFLPLKIPA